MSGVRNVNGFRTKYKEKLARVRALPPGVEALSLLKEVREGFDWAIPGFRNALKIMKDTLYVMTNKS